MADEIVSPDWRPRLESLWAAGIPLAAAMQVEIRCLDAERLVLAAPLAPNRNHMGTAFGGSLQGLATLAGWGVALVAAGEQAASHVVIRDARIRFIEPVSGELVAEAAMPSAGAVATFRGALARRKCARLTVPVLIGGPGDSIAARFVGEFVAFAPAGAASAASDCG
jgi:thioesterase domain-containing protein